MANPNPSTNDAAPLALAVTLKVMAGCEEQAIAHLRELHAATRREPGNLIYNVHQALDDAQTFFLYELYVDAAALEAHRASLHFAAHATAGLSPLVEQRTLHLLAPVAVTD